MKNNDLYILKSNVDVFSHALCENISFNNDVVVKKINNIPHSDGVKVCLQISVITEEKGKKNVTFHNKKNGELSVLTSNLIEYKNEF